MSSPLYTTLENDEIRLLTLQYVPDAGYDEPPLISCKLETVTLSGLQLAGQGQPRATGDDQWPGFNQKPLDFSVLFKPKRRHRLIGAPERSWKRYVESLSPHTTRDGIIVDEEVNGATVTPSPTPPHRYVALSYAWGPEENLSIMMMNGIEMKVRPNLRAALLELQKTSWVRRGMPLWIDALCINQDDLREREQQVGIMRSIYASAWQVVVWLGAATEATAVAYAALAWLARAMGSGDRLRQFGAEHGIQHHVYDANPVELTPFDLPWTDAVEPALRSFFARAYWHRLWILQELAMAKPDAPVLWGGHALPLCEIWVACETLDDNEPTAVDRRLDDRDATPGQQWKHLIRIKHLRGDEVGASSNGGGNVETAVPTLELARQADATDVRDKVYGILGIPGVQQLVAMAPDLSLSIDEVYTNFSQRVIESGGLDMLRLVHSPVGPVLTSWFNADNPRWLQEFVAPRYVEVAGPCTHNLPSWAVCWVCKGAPVARLTRHYGAHDGLPPPILSFLPDRVLSLQAVLVDRITNVSSFNIAEADKSYPRNGASSSSSALPNAYGDLAGLKEAFWRTIIADSTSTGDAPPASWRLLIEQRRWGRFGTTDDVKPGVNFGLHCFALRNLTMRLPGGMPLGDLLGYQGPHKPWGGNLKSDVTEKFSVTDERDAVAWASNVLAWRRLVVTADGRLGLTVAATMDGDTVAVLPGCSTPLVIRHVDAGWKLVGEIFVCGLMAGETAAMVQDGHKEISDINFC